MSNESRRIEVKIGDTSEKNIKFKLEQNVKTMEILSLKLTQEDVFKSYNADYGVVIGRVLGNGAVGIPNAKISIFIPLDSIDETNPIISSIYPYKTPQDKNQDNKRYNLLPRISKNNKPRQPFGSFPSKEEFLCNDDYLYVYEKYYKYSTTTNDSGDYMLFGVPTGSQIIHMSVDITDIGDYSMSPISMVKTLGYSPNLFTRDGSKIIAADDLSELPNIETQDISLNVIPFWGDENNFDIGITRQDFKIRAEIQSSFTIFGSCITMGISSCVGNPAAAEKEDGKSKDDGFYIMSESNGLDVRVNRLATPKITLLTYDSNKVPDLTIISGLTYNNLDGDNKDKGELVVLDNSQYASIINNGEFAVIGLCNRRKIITDNSGNEVVVDNNNPEGIFTQFAGSILIEDENPNNNIYLDKYGYPNFYWGASPRVARGRLKIPQGINKYGIEGTDITHNSRDQNDINWRKSFQIFEIGKYYSIAQFFPTRYITNATHADYYPGYSNLVTAGLLTGEHGKGGGMVFKVKGENHISEIGYDSDNTSFEGISGATTGSTSIFTYEMKPNIIGPTNIVDGVSTTNYYFGAQWLNMCLVFPQYLVADGYIRSDKRDQTVSDMFTTQCKKGTNTDGFKYNNSELITGNIRDTSRYVRPKAFQTDFIEVSKNDIDILGGVLGEYKGIDKQIFNSESEIKQLLTKYKYRPNNSDNDPVQQYEINAVDNFHTSISENEGGYIFKGMYDTDCVNLLKKNGLI